MIKKNTESGFTLIELLIIIATIGVLATIALPQYSSYRQRSFDGRSQSDLRNAITVQEAYFIDHETYTSTLSDLVTLGFKPSPGTVLTFALLTPGEWSGSSSNARGEHRFCFDSSNSVTGIAAVPQASACP